MKPPGLGGADPLRARGSRLLPRTEQERPRLSPHTPGSLPAPPPQPAPPRTFPGELSAGSAPEPGDGEAAAGLGPGAGWGAGSVQAGLPQQPLTHAAGSRLLQRRARLPLKPRPQGRQPW